MKRPDFATCGAYFIGNNTLNSSIYAQYVYEGTPRLIRKNTTSQITYKGCLALCGHGSAYYPWLDVASTITTWTLPVVGVILQAPFESNEFWATVFLLARWIGNPMASLSYTLWNIKVTGKCALLVDLAVPSNTNRQSLDPITSDFSQIRDSLYILASMNQFSFNSELNTHRREAETLLRIALFSRGLRSPGTTDRFLPTRRTEVAERLRKFRKRGVVPVYISTMWFLFSLAISIQAAMGYLGSNSEAHDLALGFLLGWLPILFLSFIVDRNFTSAEECRKQLNDLISDVRKALADDACRDSYIQTYQNRHSTSEMSAPIDRILRMPQSTQEILVKYAGQGRLRWHYGVAHPILTDMERNFIKNRGRGWLTFNEQDARSNLVLGDTDERGLIWFDLREAWQVLSSFGIVVGTILGAFIISFFEPTVGLGCRSGGYMIFVIIAFTLLILESGFWFLIAVAENDAKSPRITTVLAAVGKVINIIDLGYIYLWKAVLWKSHTKWTATKERWHQRTNRRKNRTLRAWADICIFRPIELINTAWLLYIVMAQTVGSYKTCYCQASVWGGANYIDFNEYDFSASPYLKFTWVGATVLVSSIMGISMFYIVVEWCLQSHLSTENYEAALRGLRRTRHFRRITYPYRWLFDVLIHSFWTRRSVVWTYYVTYEPKGEMPRSRDRALSTPQIVVQTDNSQGESASDTVITAVNNIHLQPMSRSGDSFTSSESAPLSMGMERSASDVGLLQDDHS